MPRVQVIPAKLELHTGQPLNAVYKRRVAGYASRKQWRRS